MSWENHDCGRRIVSISPFNSHAASRSGSHFKNLSISHFEVGPGRALNISFISSVASGSHLSDLTKVGGRVFERLYQLHFRSEGSSNVMIINFLYCTPLQCTQLVFIIKIHECMVNQLTVNERASVDLQN